MRRGVESGEPNQWIEKIVKAGLKSYSTRCRLSENHMAPAAIIAADRSHRKGEKAYLAKRRPACSRSLHLMSCALHESTLADFRKWRSPSSPGSPGVCVQPFFSTVPLPTGTVKPCICISCNNDATRPHYLLTCLGQKLPVSSRE